MFVLQFLSQPDYRQQIQDFQVINDIGSGCGDAAIEALKQIPNSWIPALIDGTPYPTRFVMPFSFVIKGSKTEESTTKKETLKISATYLDELLVTVS